MRADDRFREDFNGLSRPQPSLPSAWYTDPAHHAREMRAIWRREWVCLGRAAGLTAPGDYRVFDIDGQELVLLRDRDGENAGEIRAWRNVCRHRGSALCLERAGRLEGGRIRCPYHQWTYSFDGRLLATGPMRPIDGFERGDYGLYPVAVTVQGGFVFANLRADGAPPADSAVAPALSPLANWPLADLVVGHTHQQVLDCNWKVFWENFNECLHCPGVHPELSRLSPIYGRGLMVAEDHPDWRAHRDDADPRWSGRLRRGAESWTGDGRATAPGFAMLTDAERDAGHTYGVLYPSFFVVGHVDYARAVTLTPLGPERTALTAQFLFDPQALSAPEFDLENATRLALTVIEEDGRACEMNQRGLRADSHRQGVLMQEEYEVFAFHQWVRERVDSIDGEGVVRAGSSDAERPRPPSRRRQLTGG